MRFLFVDRITASIPGQCISGLKYVTADDYYLLSNRDNGLLFMPSLIGETLGQLAAWNVMQHNAFTFRPVAGVVSRVNFFRPVMLGETVELQATIDRLDESAVLYQAVALVNNESVLSIENALGPLLPMENFIDTNTAKAQFSELYLRSNAMNHEVSVNGIPNTIPTEICPVPDFDRVIEFTPQRSLSMQKDIDPQSSFFPDHFPRKPVLPMTMLLESCLTMAQRFFDLSAYETPWHLCALQRVKMNVFVHPGDCIQTTLTVKRHEKNTLTLLFKTERSAARVCVMEAVFESRDEYEHTS